MKKLLLLTVASLAFISLQAQFKTPGTGVRWNFDSLVVKSAGSVTKSNNVYTVTETVSIEPRDTLFVVTDIVVKFAPGTGLIFEGSSFFVNAPNLAHFTSASLTELATPPSSDSVYFTDKSKFWACLSLKDSAQIRMKKAKITFGGGIKVLLDASKGYFEMDSCEMSYNINNPSSTFFVTTSAAIDANRGIVRVTSTTFKGNWYPAFASAANGGVSFIIRNCYLSGNTVYNGNRPQINIGPALSDIPTEVVGNTVIGRRSLTNVGGISTSSLLAVETEFRIDSNYIRDNRYGITLTGSKIASKIRYNEILNNNTNANVGTGGSGVNITASGGNSHSVLTGNIIDGHHWGITLVGKTTDYSAGPTANLGNLEVPKSNVEYNAGLNVFRNNGNGGKLYDLYNNGPNAIMAQGNTWNVTTQDSVSIETTVVHKADDSRFGFVTFMYHPQASHLKIEKSSYRVYPNPSSDYVYFNQSFEKAEVFNMFGQRVMFHERSSDQLSVSSLSEGSYVVRLYHDQAISTVKIQIIR